MPQFYTDPEREKETYALPDAETFFRTVEENAEYGFLDGDDDPMPDGWYWWACFPGCMPEGDPMGPFDSEDEAIEDARDF